MSRSRKILWALAIFVVGYIGYGALPDAGEMLSGARAKDTERAALLEQVRLADEASLGSEVFLKDLDAARSAVPSEPGLPALIADLDQTIKLAGMRWTSGAPSPQDAGLLEGGNGEWQFSMTVSGDMQRVPSLLRELRELERLVAVDSVQVRSEGTGVTVQISLRFFAFPGDPLAFDTPVAVPAETQDPGVDGN
jgi:Tfp pilus assembly protein PilO